LILIYVVVADDELDVVLIVGSGERDVIGGGKEEVAFRAIFRLSFTIADADAAELGDEGVQPREI
jgi:hypothetical protein